MKLHLKINNLESFTSQWFNHIFQKGKVDDNLRQCTWTWLKSSIWELFSKTWKTRFILIWHCEKFAVPSRIWPRNFWFLERRSTNWAIEPTGIGIASLTQFKCTKYLRVQIPLETTKFSLFVIRNSAVLDNLVLPVSLRALGSIEIDAEASWRAVSIGVIIRPSETLAIVCGWLLCIRTLSIWVSAWQGSSMVTYNAHVRTLK